jgi:hypothetical protein
MAHSYCLHNRFFNFIALALLLIAASQTYANTAENIVYFPSSNTTVASKSTGEIYTTATTKSNVVQFPKNKSLKVKYSQNRVLELAKKAKKGTAINLAIMGVLAGTDWVLDELSGDIVKNDVISDNHFNFDHNGSFYYVEVMPDLYAAGTNYSSVKDYANDNLKYPKTPYSLFSGASNKIDFIHHANRSLDVKYNYILRYTCSSGTIPQFNQICGVASSPSGPTKEDINQGILNALNKLTDSQYLSIFNNHFGHPLNTPEFNAALKNWLSQMADNDPNLNYNPDTNTLTKTDPETGIIEEINIKPESVNENFTETNKTPEPEPCSTFQPFCDFVEWFKAEDPAINNIDEVPYEDVNLADLEKSFNPSLGGGSCPASRSISFGGQSVSIDFKVACDGARNYFKPVLISIATIMAVMIIAGASRR